MDKNSIIYTPGYKYQLDFTYHYQDDRLDNLVPSQAGNHYITIYNNGTIEIANGYAWDGPSGPTIDTKDFMRGSLIHDSLYQLIREGYLGLAIRPIADQILRDVCRQDGMSWLRSQIVYLAVKEWGTSSALPPAEKQPISAP